MVTKVEWKIQKFRPEVTKWPFPVMGVTYLWPKCIQQQDAFMGPIWVPHSQNAPTNQLRVIMTSTKKSPKNPHFYPLRGVKCNKKFQAAKMTLPILIISDLPPLCQFWANLVGSFSRTWQFYPFSAIGTNHPLKMNRPHGGPSPRPECAKRCRADHPGQAGWCIGFCDIIDERRAPARLRSTNVVQLGFRHLSLHSVR